MAKPRWRSPLAATVAAVALVAMALVDVGATASIASADEHGAPAFPDLSVIDASRAPAQPRAADVGPLVAPEECLVVSGTAVTALRYAGDNRYETAVCASFWTWYDHDDPDADERLLANAVVLARGDEFPDALAGGPLASHLQGPLLLTRPGSLPPAVLTEIQRVLPPGGLVYLLGATPAISGDVESQVQSAGFTTKRLAGANRYETAIAIAEELPATSNFFFATGRNFPDALGAATAAAALSLAARLDEDPATRPFAVLLTSDESMPAVTSSFATARRDQFEGWILATTGAQADQAAVDAFGAGELAARFVGSNRYETAALIAEGVFTDAAGELVGAGVGLATGRNFPDGLSASAALAPFAEPLLLVRTNRLPEPTRAFLADHAGEASFLDIFGGTPAVSDAVVDAAVAVFEGGARCATPSGPILDLNADLAGQVGIDIPVVFNRGEGEFLVAWNQSLDVFTRRVGADGSLPGAVTPVITGPDVFTDVDLAHHPDRNEYFISWKFQGGSPSSLNFNNAYGRRLSATGAPDGEVVHVSHAAFESTMDFNPVTGEYFHHARNFAGGGLIPGILFRRIDELGQPFGTPSQIIEYGGPGEAEVNPFTGEVLSTWRGSSSSDPVLRGQLLSPTGTPLGDSFVIADLFPAVRTASVAFDLELARYLVVFSTFYEPSPLLHAQFVSAQGEPIGPRLTLADENAALPRVAYDPVNRVFLVTWFAAGSALWAQLLSPQGVPLGEPRDITAGTTVPVLTGRVASNTNDGGFLVSWRGDEQVAARTVEVVKDCSAVP
jgi:hypothetical protein